LQKAYLIFDVSKAIYNLFAVIIGVLSFFPATFSLFIIYILEIKIIKLPANKDMDGVSLKI
tara:strand:- start:1 stop:183 length:183 start_codon:yes stop_codon:yes gene_type:complete